MLPCARSGRQTIDNRFTSTEAVVGAVAVGVEEVADAERLGIRRRYRDLPADGRSHPAVLANVPQGRVAGVGRMVETGDPLGRLAFSAANHSIA